MGEGVGPLRRHRRIRALRSADHLEGSVLQARWSRFASMTIRKIHRDAKTGRFIPEKVAKRRPSTTVTETVKVPAPKPKKKRS